MTLPRFLLIAAASWSILAAIGTTGWCAALAWWRRDRVVRIEHLPPVPESDADWLSAWPSGPALIDFDAVHGLLSEPRKELAPETVDRMFCEIVAAEGLQ